jgi:biotin carboxylase
VSDTQSADAGTLLLVAAGLLQVPAITIAKEMGLRVVATDRSPDAAAFPLVDEAVVLDTKDVEGHVALARSLAQRGDLVAVYTEGADVEVTVARAAEAVGLPGCNPRAAEICSNKSEFRRVSAEAGLPGPRFQEVQTLAEAQLALRDVGFPAIVKAVDNSASRGATKIEEEEALADALEEALHFSGTGTALIEQCLQGPEQSVETIVDQAGRQHRCNIVDRPFAFDPFPIELGHDNPTRLSDSEQEQLFELVEAHTRAVGIALGAAKADTMWTAQGPVVIEMTARLSGGFHSQYTSPLAHGTNDIKATLDLALGRDLDLADVTPRWSRFSVCRSLFPEPGAITEIDGIEEALELPGVEHVLFRMGVGEVIRPYRHCADRAGFVITCADDREQAEEAAAQAQQLIKVATAPPALA